MSSPEPASTDHPVAPGGAIPGEADVARYLDYLAHERRYSAHTLRNYGQALATFLKWLHASRRWRGSWQALGRDRVRGYFLDLGRRLDRATVRNHAAAMRGFWRFLQRGGAVDHDPFAGLVLPKLKKGLPVYLSEAQMRELLNAPVRLAGEEVISKSEALRDRLAMELIYGGGLRISEAVGLTYGMVDMTNGVARITGKGGKERVSPVGRVALACLLEWKTTYAPATGRNDRILLSNRRRPWHARGIQLMLKRYLAVAGLPQDITPHKLRHSYATHMLNGGADLRLLQELLGHASLSTTQIYTHLAGDRLKAVHHQAHPRG